MKLPVEFLRQGVRGALEVRLKCQVKNDRPICIYDIADQLGLEVKFCAGKSFGGMYAKALRTILVPTLRPPGRRAFTCAHELAHWFFNHGNRIDDPLMMEQASDDDPDEQLAHTFASYILMPPWAVKKAFDRRGWNPKCCSPLQIYMIAINLGVGYSTLIQHMSYALRLISQQQAHSLLKTTPKQIRMSMIPNDEIRHLVIADYFWSDVPIDIQVGDMAILPGDAHIDAANVEILGPHELGIIVRGLRSGIGRIESLDRSWASFIRVSKKDYEGRCRYRHLEDPDVDKHADFDL